MAVLVRIGSPSSGIQFIRSDGALVDAMERGLGDLTYPYGWLASSSWFGVFGGRQFPHLEHTELGWLHVSGSGPEDL